MRRSLRTQSGDPTAKKNEDRTHTIEAGGSVWTPAGRPSLASLNTVAAATGNLGGPVPDVSTFPEDPASCRTRSMTPLRTLVLSLGLPSTLEPAVAQIVTEHDTLVTGSANPSRTPRRGVGDPAAEE